jgi:acetoin utilization deacetylase AcuC-like enzyme
MNAGIGNGTEEIVRNLAPHLTHLPLPPSWAPVSKLSYKPWLCESDVEDVFFASVHKFEGVDFYPGSGDQRLNESHNTNSSSTRTTPRIVNISLTALPPKVSSVCRESKKKIRKPEELIKTASDEFRKKIQEMLLPGLEAFRPDLLLMSTGLDAHYDDAYHFLSEDDVHWVTQHLCELMDRVGGKGVVSVLEGGYSLTSAENAPVPAQGSVASTTQTTPAVHAIAGNMSLRHKNKTTGAQLQIEPTGTSTDADTRPIKERKYALRPGDGGLVKG